MAEPPQRPAKPSGAGASGVIKHAPPPGVPPADTARAADSVPMTGGPFTVLPTRFGKYEIRKELGHGQMGAVYLAHDTELDRLVALKVARVSASGSAKILKRMEIEAKAAAKVHHPNICKVYDFGEIDGVRFIALQYIKGEDLKRLMKRTGRRREPGEAVRLIVQILGALAAAHKNGVIHRDLKPENVMMNEMHEPVIMDFGLARRSVASSDAGLTQGMIVGTAAYMSPEQATGRAEAIDQRSDLYAVGVMLYEMLTGEWPFTGGALEVMGKKCVQEPVSPRCLNAGLHSELAAICHKMVAKQKEDRYSTCEEVIQALEAIELMGTEPLSEPVNRADSMGVFDFQSTSLGTLALKKTSLVRAAKPKARLRTFSAVIPTLRGRWRKQSPLVRWLISAVPPIFVLIIALIMYIHSGDAVIKVEIHADNASVTTQNGTMTLSDGVRTIKVSPGDQILHIRHQDLEFDTNKFTLKQGKNPSITVEIVDSDIVTRFGDQEIGRRPLNSKPNPTRENVKSANLAAKAPDPKGAPNAKNDRSNAEVLPQEKWIDLLELVRIPDHVILGNWTRLDHAVVCESFPRARFMAPVAVTGSYQVNCKFTRRTGMEAVSLMLPVGETACALMLDGWSGTISGLNRVDKRGPRDLVDSGAAIRPIGPLANSIAHEVQVKVSQKNHEVQIQVSLDEEDLINWNGNANQLSAPEHYCLPNPHAVGVVTFSSVVEIHELKLRLDSGASGFRFGDDWNTPLNIIADKPPEEVASDCVIRNGRSYFISKEPLVLPDAQLLATQLKGRLLTISSSDEEQFILEEGRGRKLWMAGWRPPMASIGWRDERNRPLRFIGTWGSSQPDHHGEIQWQLCIWTGQNARGWHDVETQWPAMHACIEWGEEYADERPKEPALIYCDAKGQLVTNRLDGSPSQSLPLDQEIPLPIISIAIQSPAEKFFILGGDRVFSLPVSLDAAPQRICPFLAGVAGMAMHPTRERLAWCRRIDGIEPQIIISDVAGQELENLGFGYDPFWASDGKTLVFTGPGPDLGFSVNVRQGSDTRQIAVPIHPTVCVFPSVSNDGRQIAFAMKAQDGSRQIGLASIAGTDLKQLTIKDDGNTFPVFSPDDRKIAFVRSLGQSVSIMIVDIESGEETLVADSVAYVRPVWTRIPRSR